MRIVCIGREASDYGRSIGEWIREFERRTGSAIENVDPDSSEGESLCRTYDVVEYPTIMALGDEDGSLKAMWRGRMLPTFDEVAYWLNA